ncbi:unnamed protein product (macronuclear) [Paramecium tetraurelia]|uniref:Uncharacterized protein n=1 Tax=Paramecium tetraurelia TaxID=5888 RepID=A0CGN3_PARTE|nr:uncharacterized protein GSPATT00007390001 [Paramecium tetraurelia]CAK69950.1 unnamed protein product [Paramecium tetraurelia]|eukprot:XP_001437347.1 hypothetical protein (macronuclear) [Paramecium tetraurelia strain d4-2]
MSQSTFAAFLYFFEIPALTWQRESFYTPTEQRPRCYYMPLFQIEWISDIPQVWTVFYGLCGRKYFERQHLAYVDRNQIQFHQILEDEEHIDL